MKKKRITNGGEVGGPVVRTPKSDEQKKGEAEACIAEVKGILDHYGCRLVAVPHVTPDGRIGANVQITND